MVTMFRCHFTYEYLFNCSDSNISVLTNIGSLALDVWAVFTKKTHLRGTDAGTGWCVQPRGRFHSPPIKGQCCYI